jgi:CRISPR/Cas system endoribonuclease Cas6 (RAMP superfamily)
MKMQAELARISAQRAQSALCSGKDTRLSKNTKNKHNLKCYCVICIKTWTRYGKKNIIKLYANVTVLVLSSYMQARIMKIMEGAAERGYWNDGRSEQ